MWSAEPVVLLRLAVVLVCAGCCWMEGTNQDEQAQRPIMMRAPKTYELGPERAHVTAAALAREDGKLKHVGLPWELWES